MGVGGAGGTADDGDAGFAADTGDLTHYAERGRTYVARLEDLLARLDRRRRLVGATVGPGLGPPDLVTLTFRELIAEAALNNGMVDLIRESLAQYGGTAAVPDDAGSAIQRTLAEAGLGRAAVDLPLADDRALLRRFRTERLAAAGLPAAAAAALVDDSAATAAALLLLAEGVHPDVVAGAWPGRLESVAGAFDRGHVSPVGSLEALLSGGYGSTLRDGVIRGRLEPPDDRLRDLVVAAMLAGLGPGDVGTDPAYFPPSYRHHRALGERIAELQARRSEVDGRWWSWWDGDADEMAAIDRELDGLRAERAALGREHHIDGDGTVGHLDAVAAVSRVNGGSRWEGQTYAFVYQGHRETLLSRSRPFGGEGSLREPRGFAPELDHLARRVAADPAVAVAFYNRLGVAAVADLVTLAAGNGLGRAGVDRFGRGLASASRATTPDGRPRLAFGGGDLLHRRPSDTDPGVVGYSPALLFLDGDPRDEFLAAAAVAALELAQSGDRWGHVSHRGRQLVDGMLAPTVLDGGEDPRNILLSRVAERPGAIRAVLHRLADPPHPGWSGEPSPGSLAPLLEPTVPFAPTLGSDPGRLGWFEQLGELGTVAAPGSEVLGPLAYPDLAHPYPITAFLTAAAPDDEASRWILRSVARSAGSGEPAVPDVGTAAGLDAILANHASLLFTPDELEAAGIARTGLNEGAVATVGPGHWKAVHREVLRHGRGQALAGAADALLRAALRNATDADGRFDPGPIRPFAHVLARVEAELHEGSFARYQRLDAAARLRNRKATTTVGVAIGLLPAPGPLTALAGGAWSWYFDGESTDGELEFRRHLWAEQYYGKDPAVWKKRVAEVSLLARTEPFGEGEIELEVPGLGRRTVALRRAGVDGDGSTDFAWRDPRTGEWSPVPAPGEGRFGDLFPPYDPPFHRQVVSAGDAVDENIRDGLLVSAVGRPDIVARILGATEDAGPDLADAVADAGWTERWLGRP